MITASGSERAARVAQREERKRIVSEIAARVERRIGATALGFIAGVSRALARRWADAEDDAQIGVADVAGLEPADRAPFAEYLAGPGFMMAELPSVEADGRASMSLHGRAMAAAFRLVEKHAAAIADRGVDRTEGADLEAACDELLRETLTVREMARAAQRDGVVRLRAVEG